MPGIVLSDFMKSTTSAKLHQDSTEYEERSRLDSKLCLIFILKECQSKSFLVP